MYELINDVQIKVKEYKGQRVVTFNDIDTAHKRPSGTAKRNFNKNIKHFIEGEDYFKVCWYEIRTNKSLDISPKTHRDVILFTESGYLMIVKSFTDDLSWSVQRQLVKTYFRVREISNLYNEDIYKRFDMLEQKIDIIYQKLEMSEKRIDTLEINIKKSITDNLYDAVHTIIPAFEVLYKKINRILYNNYNKNKKKKQ